MHLLGNTLNVATGSWIHGNAGIGGGSDSYFEYLVKCYVLFQDGECWDMFRHVYTAIQVYAFKQPWYVEVSMVNGKPMYLDAQGLAAFWPAVNVLVGDVPQANVTHRAYLALWKRYGVLPERHSIATDTVHHSEKYYLLRPELAESTYYLYKATKDPFYLHAGRVIWQGIETYTKAYFGYASLKDVGTKQKEDRMNSFFLSETCKYLYLLFDDSPEWDQWVFTTEGHPLKLPRKVANNATAYGREKPRVPLQTLRCPAKPNPVAASDKANQATASCGQPPPAPDKQKEAVNQPRVVSSQLRELKSKLLVKVEMARRKARKEGTDCHVKDKRGSHRCQKDGDCGIDGGTCGQRVCSEHRWCVTPEA